MAVVATADFDLLETVLGTLLYLGNNIPRSIEDGGLPLVARVKLDLGASEIVESYQTLYLATGPTHPIGRTRYPTLEYLLRSYSHSACSQPNLRDLESKD